MINQTAISNYFSLSDPEKTTLNHAVNAAHSFDLFARSKGTDMLAKKIHGKNKDRVAALLIDRCQSEQCFLRNVSQQPHIIPEFESYSLMRPRTIALELASRGCSYFNNRGVWIPVAPSEQDLEIQAATRHLFNPDDFN